MPKVKYTEAKGLYQEAGTGLDLEGSLALTGALSVSKTLSFSSNLVGSRETVSSGTVVSLNSLITLLDTTAAALNSLAIAAGTAGQIKVVIRTAGGNNAVLTPAGGLVGTTTNITFDTIGDAVILVYTGAEWAVVSNYGCTIA